MVEDPSEHIAFLTSSQNRITILQQLADSPGRQSELVRRCDISKATVHRAIDDMENRGWVTEKDGEYQLTALGTALITHYDEFEESFASVLRKRAFFEHFDTDVEIPTDVVTDFELTTPVSGDPHATMEVFRNEARSGDIDWFAGILPIMSPGYIEIAENMFDAGAQMELIVAQGAVDAMQSNYGDDLERALGADNFSLYIYPGQLQMALATFDHDRAMIASVDENDQLHAGLDGGSDTVLDWTTKMFESIRAQSQPLM